MYITTFEVTGRGSFPLDMLRYDTCFPARGGDVHLIGTRLMSEEQRSIQLSTIHKHKTQAGVTPDRWESFGWTVEIIRTAKVG